MVATLLLIYNCSRARDELRFTDGCGAGVLCWHSAVYERGRQASREVEHVLSRWGLFRLLVERAHLYCSGVEPI